MWIGISHVERRIVHDRYPSSFLPQMQNNDYIFNPCVGVLSLVPWSIPHSPAILRNEHTATENQWYLDQEAFPCYHSLMTPKTRSDRTLIQVCVLTTFVGSVL